MTTPLIIIAAIVVLGLMYVLMPVLVQAQLRFQKPRQVTCPETHQTATVELDASQAALTGLTGDPKLRLTHCSRWPEHEGCAEDCVAQIHLSPEGYAK